MTLDDKKIVAKTIVLYSIMLALIYTLNPAAVVYGLFFGTGAATLFTVFIRAKEKEANEELEDEIDYDGNEGY